jgi:hypothetical protein
MLGFSHGCMKVVHLSLLLLCITLGCQSSRPTSLSVDEQPVLEVPANLWRGWEAVGGNLTITNKRVLFLPHALNAHKSPVEISIDRIVAVGPISYHRVPLRTRIARVKVHTKTGEEYEFVVEDGDRFVKALGAQFPPSIEN